MSTANAGARHDGATITLPAFLLTREWHDRADCADLVLWCRSERGPLRIRLRDPQAVCFVERGARLPPHTPVSRRRAVALRSPEGMEVDALYFPTQRALLRARDVCRAHGVRLYESDVRAADRYLMERFVLAGLEATGPLEPGEAGLRMLDPVIRPADPDIALQAVSLDIETDGSDGQVYSVALATAEHECVLMCSANPVHAATVPVHCHASERAMLQALLRWFAEHDPDLVIGWNVIGFDLSVLERRFAANHLPFDLGRDGGRARILPAGRGGQPATARIPGRVVLDGIESLRAAFWTFEDYSLEAVARSLLGRGKLLDAHADRIGAVRTLYAEDRAALAEYNIEDCRLTAAIFAHTGLVRMAVQRARMTGLTLGRHGGSAAVLDSLYLPRLHRRGRVAHDVGAGSAGAASSPGGHVLNSRPGLYRHVVLLDFKSLYPSIMRTFRIDPLGLWQPGEDPVEGFLGARFARHDAILPALIDDLWAARDAAKREHNAPLSQTIKIIMNAFYGVLGSSGCRFFDPRLASSITRRGHEVLKRSRDLLEAEGLSVIYGDTDSLFVLLDTAGDHRAAQQRGSELASMLNAWWRATIAREHRLESCLEVEFETCFSRFLMPTLRGSELGSKKRYAGLAVRADGSTELVFKGLESVRSDWTPLARGFQRELYRRVFADEPYTDYVRDTLAALLGGQLDEQLVYRKRLRRGIDEYRGNVPPQVHAARQSGQRSGWVRYIITRQGPQAVAHATAPPDYDHYRERQLAPVADGILYFLGTSFAALTDRQLAIF